MGVASIRFECQEPAGHGASFAASEEPGAEHRMPPMDWLLNLPRSQLETLVVDSVAVIVTALVVSVLCDLK